VHLFGWQLVLVDWLVACLFLGFRCSPVEVCSSETLSCVNEQLVPDVSKERILLIFGGFMSS
jgi:hypothetical protein